MPKIITDNTPMGEILHSWVVPEYEQHSRNRAWHIIMLSVGLLLVLYGMFSDNFLFSLIIILVAIILFMQSRTAAPELPVGITDLGIAINNRFYTYNELTGFYIIYNPPQTKMLYIETKSATRPLLRMPLLDQNPVEIRHALQEFLPEDLEKEEEPAIDAFARTWKIH